MHHDSIAAYFRVALSGSGLYKSESRVSSGNSPASYYTIVTIVTVLAQPEADTKAASGREWGGGPGAGVPVWYLIESRDSDGQ